MFKKSGKTRGNCKSRFTFETMERRELMTASPGMAMEPVEAPVAVVASPIIPRATFVSDNTMAGAWSMGTLSGSVTYSGSVGGTDPADWWKFRVANSGATTIQLAGLSRDVDIQILDSTGRVVLATGERDGTNAESVTVNLQAGQDYFIKVYPWGSGPMSNYQLSVNAPRPLSDDTPAGASWMGTVATSVTYGGSVGGMVDPLDYWKFRVANSGATTIRLAGMSRDLNIQIEDSSGRILASGTRGGTLAESVTVNLQAGQDYYIKVYPYTPPNWLTVGFGPVSSYQLSITAPTAAPVDPDPFTMPLGTVTTSVTRNGTIGGADPVDWFKFQVANSGATTIRLTGMSRDVNINIVKADGTVLASGWNRGTSSESLTLNLQAGVDYYIKVYPNGSGPVTNYQLSITAPTAAPVDPDPFTMPLGTVTTSVTRNGTIGGADPVDWFKFQVANSGATTIRLAGMSRDVNINIVKADGTVLASGWNPGTSSESLTVILQAGVDYFIKVYPNGSGPVTNYQLSINAPNEWSDDTSFGAQPIGSVYNTTRTMYGRVGGSDPVDFFSFWHGPEVVNNLTARQVHISLTGLTADLDLQVFDSSGNLVGRSTQNGLTSESRTLSLITGRQYFIRVYPYGALASNYTLTVSG